MTSIIPIIVLSNTYLFDSDTYNKNKLEIHLQLGNSIDFSKQQTNPISVWKTVV